MKVTKTISGSLRIGGDVFARRCEGGYDVWARDRTGWFCTGPVAKNAADAKHRMVIWYDSIKEAKDGFVQKPIM